MKRTFLQHRPCLGALPAALAAALLYLPAHGDEPAHVGATTAHAVPAVALGAETGTEGSTAHFKKVGEARLKVLLWSIYDSRLFTPSGRYDDGDRPLRLELQYLRDVKANLLVDRTRDEWDAMGRNHPHRGAWLDALTQLWPDIAAGDVLAFELNRNNVATFRHNGEVLGRIEDPEFGQQFVDIWLSRDCTRPALRTALLGAED